VHETSYLIAVCKTLPFCRNVNIFILRLFIILDPGLESWDYSHRDMTHWPRYILYLQKLALTSPTCGIRSVGIVRSRAKAAELLVIHNPRLPWELHFSHFDLDFFCFIVRTVLLLNVSELARACIFFYSYPLTHCVQLDVDCIWCSCISVCFSYLFNFKFCCDLDTCYCFINLGVNLISCIQVIEVHELYVV
jgi:hypothetical protein